MQAIVRKTEEEHQAGHCYHREKKSKMESQFNFVYTNSSDVRYFIHWYLHREDVASVFRVRIPVFYKFYVENTRL